MLFLMHIGNFCSRIRSLSCSITPSLEALIFMSVVYLNSFRGGAVKYRSVFNIQYYGMLPDSTHLNVWFFFFFWYTVQYMVYLYTVCHF